MSCRTLIIGLSLINTAIFASDATIELQKTKLRLRTQIVASIPRTTDGTIFAYPHEFQDIVTCMKPIETLIDQAESTEQCNLIQQKLSIAKVIIRNRAIFARGGDYSTVYYELIPKIFGVKELSSIDDIEIHTPSWQPK